MGIFPTPRGTPAPQRPSPLLSPTLGPPIPIVYGRAYVPGRIVFVDAAPTRGMGQFWSIDHSRWEGSLGFHVSKAVMVFCEAPVTSLGIALCNGRPVDISPAAGGLSRFCGFDSSWQAIGGISATMVEGSTSSIFATTGQGYEGTAHWRAPFLHREGGIPSVQWLVSGACVRGGDTYAHPADVLVDLLTNTRYGLGLSALVIVTTVGIDGNAASSYENYVNAYGLRVNRALTEQESAKDAIESLLAETNSVAVWSEGKLKIIPMDWRAKGVYTPPVSAVVMDEDEILMDGGSDPVTMLRTPDSEVFNHWPVSSKTADDSYAENVYGVPDGLDVQLHGGIRTASTTTASWLATRQMVADYSSFLTMRSLRIRNRFRFRVGPRWCLLEPMDLITITDPHLGLENEPCRIVTVEEQDDGSFVLEADEYPGQVRPVDLTPQPYDGAGNTNQGSDGGDDSTPGLVRAATNYVTAYLGVSGTFPAVVQAPAVEIGGPRTIVAVGGNASPACFALFSLDDGDTWTAATTAPPSTHFPYALGTFQIGLTAYFLSAGSGAGGNVKAYVSGDAGVTYAAASLPADNGNLYGYLNDGTQAIVIGHGGAYNPRMYSSTDMSAWTTRSGSLPAGIGWRSIAFDGTNYVALSINGEVATGTSLGSAFTLRSNLPGSGVITGKRVVYSQNEGAFIALGIESTLYATLWKSKDAGVTWTRYRGPAVSAVWDLSVESGIYLVTATLNGATGNSLALTMDGQVWSSLQRDPKFDPVNVLLTDLGAARRWLYVGTKPGTGNPAQAWFARSVRF